MVLSANMSEPGREEPQGPLQVLQIATLVCVYKDQVKRPLPALDHLGEQRFRLPDLHLGPVPEAGPCYVLACYQSVPLVYFEGDERATFGEGAGQVYRAVTTERIDLQDTSPPCYLR